MSVWIPSIEACEHEEKEDVEDGSEEEIDEDINTTQDGEELNQNGEWENHKEGGIKDH